MKIRRGRHFREICLLIGSQFKRKNRKCASGTEQSTCVLKRRIKLIGHTQHKNTAICSRVQTKKCITGVVQKRDVAVIRRLYKCLLVPRALKKQCLTPKILHTPRVQCSTFFGLPVLGFPHSFLFHSFLFFSFTPLLFVGLLARVQHWG